MWGRIEQRKYTREREREREKGIIKERTGRSATKREEKNEINCIKNVSFWFINSKICIYMYVPLQRNREKERLFADRTRERETVCR